MRLARKVFAPAIASALLAATGTAATAAPVRDGQDGRGASHRHGESTTTQPAAGQPAAGQAVGTELLGNSSAAVNLSGWAASSSAGTIAVSRVTGVSGPFAATTAVRLSRSAVKGSWAYASAALTAPATSFVVGQTYRMQAWVRDTKASGQNLEMLLANQNYAHRPTEVSVFGAFRDTGWHQITRTFVATAPASADTTLILCLPESTAFDFQVAMASVTAVNASLPARTTAAPARVVSFAGAAGSAPDSTIWNYDLGGNGWGGGELQSYTAARANSQQNGSGGLALTARREAITGTDGIRRNYSSARLTTKDKLSVAPGSYVEVTISAPVGNGVWPAFWLLGTNIDSVGWPASGELDAFEGWGSDPTLAHAAAHMSSSSNADLDLEYGWGEAGGTTDLGASLAAAPHQYGVYFDNNVVRFYLDRKPTLTIWASDAAASGRAWAFGRSMYLLLNIAVSDEVTAATTFPQTMTVKGISVWSGGVPA